MRLRTFACSIYKMCVDTGRAGAAILAVAVTCLAGLRVGAAVRTRAATLKELHVVWTFLVCGDKHFVILVTAYKLSHLS